MATRPRRLPTFLFIGADKAGSTWLAEVLRQHPRCFVPSAKDVYFFDRYYDRGLDWYARLFASASRDATALGELSHDYLYSRKAAERIARDLPDVRLVAFLRHPVERCFSEYLYLVRSGLTRKVFRDALGEFPEVVDHSRYAAHLRRYLELFGRDRLGVFFFDDLQADPATFARDVLRFLDLDWVDGIDVYGNPLPAARPRSAALARLARLAADRARALGAPGLVGSVKRSRLTRVLYSPYGANSRPRLDDEMRHLLESQLGSQPEELRRLLGTDVPARWRMNGAT